jgi:S-adenosylmethionine-diacylglycerol 3-amino-3-carboxypropyl transferase
MSNYFTDLNYSLGDEDSSVELGILPEGAKHVIAIAGSGGRALPLLAKCPRKLTCIDFSPPQLAFTHLRLSLLKRVQRETFLEFMGYAPGMSAQQRRTLFESLDIAPTERELLVEMLGRDKWGPPAYQGRFERMLQKMAFINSIFTGPAGRRIFEHIDIADQRNYYLEGFPKYRWNTILRLMGNSAALNSILYRGAFPKNNLGISSFQLYQNVFNSLFTTIFVRESFFAQMIFFGELRFPEGFPVECNEDVYANARRALKSCDVEIVKGDLLGHIEKLTEIDFVSLSDVPSFMPDSAAVSVLQRIKPSLSKNALAIIRGHQRVVHPVSDHFIDVSSQYQRLIESEKTQLWRIQVYQYAAACN